MKFTKNLKNKKIIEILKNKKFRSLIILVLYFIFFTIIILSFNQNGDLNNEQRPNDNLNNKNQLNALNNYKLMTNYKWSCLVNEIDKLNGIVKNDIVYINFNNSNYQLISEKLFQDGAEIEDDFINSVLVYNPNYIFNLIQNGELKFENKIFTDNSIEIEKTYLGTVTKDDEPIIVRIKTLELDNFIYKISLNYEDVATNLISLNNISSIVINYEKE